MNAKRTWLRKLACSLPGVGLAGWLAWTSWQARAQEASSPAPASKVFLNKTIINLPILIDERHRPQVASVHLYVKKGAAQPWRLCDKAPPTQAAFTYSAPQEGEYWFNIASVDKAGRMTPPDISKEAPAIVVVLDTQAPQVELQPMHAAPEGHYVQCQWRDPNLDAYKSRLFYQTGDQVWRSLDAVPGKVGAYCIPAQAAWNGTVRAVAVDLAGNTTTKEMSLNPMATTAAAPTKTKEPLPTVAQPADLPPGFPMTVPMVTGALPPAPAPSAILQTQVNSVNPPGAPENIVLPMPTRERSLDARDVVLPPPAVAPSTVVVDPPPRLTPPNSLRTTAEKNNPVEVIVSQKIATTGSQPQLFDPALPGVVPPAAASLDVKTASAAALESPAMRRQFTNSTRLHLDYRIESLGASGVGKVEVWYTRDLGQSWQKLCEDTDRQSPADIELPGEGVYGITLSISNGRGFGGAAPKSGDTPDSWIEVDTTKPVAELVQIRAGTGDDGAALHIAWRARDKNLAGDSAELQFAATREGPWQTIAKGLKSEGIYRWVAPVEVGAHAFIRLTVRDQANNLVSVETPQAVPLDDASRPRGRVLGISTATPPRSSGPSALAPQ